MKYPIADIDSVSARDNIIIKGANVNNLKNLTVVIPRNKLVVITGLSGSGKSSLAFDTLFAEGQRMYVESLSSYARQFLGRMEKPDVEYIRGVSPAIAIKQKINSKNPRSTVGTTTEIYDYLKLLFARIGKTYSPISGREVTKDSVSAIVEYASRQSAKIMVSAPITFSKKSLAENFELLLRKGFARVLRNQKPMLIEDALQEAGRKNHKLAADRWHILIDRIDNSEPNDDVAFRLTDSIHTAFYEGHGSCALHIEKKDGWEEQIFSDQFALDGMNFVEPTVNFFNFNNPYGACRTCEGLGQTISYSEDLIFPNKNLSVYEQAVAPWRGATMSQWAERLIMNGIKFDFPIHRPVSQLTAAQKRLLWTGNEYFKGLNDFFHHLESKSHKMHYRVLAARFRGRATCPDCLGTKLRKDAGYVKINNASIIDLILLSIDEAAEFFLRLPLSDFEKKVSDRLLTEIASRLHFMRQVGLGYLTLNRAANTLSGGEYQRIKLATSLGSALVGAMYILDEPSIGLHPRDTDRMIDALLHLKRLGNTVIVVEHEEEVMRAADQIIDIGPKAGALGGELVFQGNYREAQRIDHSHTVNYLTGKEKIPLPPRRRKWKNFVAVKGACENNLKSIDAQFPLGALTVITGVSGSGKSTLLKKILYPALARILGESQDAPGKYEALEGDVDMVKQVEFIDQHPIGKSSRSNPVSYIGAYDGIRQLYAKQPLSVQRDYKPGYFSFNIEGGRCETCQGEGQTRIEMQFMADVFLTCEACGGKRFKPEVLEVEYQGKNIADALALTIDESVEFFKAEAGIVHKLSALQEVGLGYMQLGQSSNTLSGGEAQRIKLASFMDKKFSSDKGILFIFDEPTTGLHFHDISLLLKAINALVDEGHTAILIEHNLEVIKSADWIIDLGPEAGDKDGGQLLFAGTPEDMIKQSKGHTARFLKEKMKA